MQIKEKLGSANRNYVLGHIQEYELISAAAENKHVSWLLCGQRGVGKASVAYMAINHIFGVDQTTQQQNIIREQIANNNFLDLFIADNDLISVDDIRRIRRFFHTTPALSKWRIALIDSVESMSRGAMNAMLKLLEEPPENSLFFLISHMPGALPLTITSRCFRVNFSILSNHDIENILLRTDGVKKSKDITRVAMMSLGSLGMAFSLLNYNAVDLYHDFLFMIETRAVDYDKIESFGAQNDLWNVVFFVARLLLSRIIKSSVRGELGAEIVPKEIDVMEKISQRFSTQYLIEKWSELCQNVNLINDIKLRNEHVLINFFYSIL